MPYDAALAARIRKVVSKVDGYDEKRMFGGLAFLVNGHMAVAASGQGGLLLRCDPEATAAHVTTAGVERFSMRGREMNGWLHVADSAVAHATALRRWVKVGLSYVATLPPK